MTGLNYFIGKISRRLFLTLLLVALIPLAVIGLRTYQVAKDLVEQEVFLQMEAVAGYKAGLIENWLEERIDDLSAALHSGLVIKGDLRKGSPALFSAVSSDNFQSVALIFENQILLSPGSDADDTLWATKLSDLIQKEHFGTQEVTIYGKTEYSPDFGTWFTLLKAFPDQSGQYMIAAGRVKIAQSLDRLLCDSIGLGLTGQSYLIDSEHTMLTGSRFHGHPAAGTHKMASPAIDSALAGFQGVGVYGDWVGALTLGAWRTVPGPGWALVAEMSQSESMMPVARLRREWLIIIALTIILTGVVASLLSRSLGRPVVRLSEVSREVAKGNLETRTELDRSDELGELAKSFDQMIDSLRKSNEALDRSYRDLVDKNKRLLQSEKLATVGELVASVVHELRNPLSAIKMNLNILSKGAKSSSIEVEQFQIATEQTERMERMLGTILEYSKPVQPTISCFQVVRLIEQIIASHDDSDIKFDFTRPTGNLEILGDKELIAQALDNVVSNAIHSVDDKESRIISISSKLSDSKDSIVITVTDNGSGISTAQLERVFEPFFTTRTAGTGLGLPNVKKVMDIHRGKIDIFSQLGEGTTVTLTLPIEYQDA